MLIEPILGYKSTWRILGLLFETPRKVVSRKELFEHTKLGNAPLSEGLQRLTAVNLLIKEKKGKKESYYLNLGNEKAILLMGLWETERKDLRFLDYDIKTILSEITRQLVDTSGVKDLILFGSYARGTASVRSDIDLAVVFKEKVMNEIEITRMLMAIRERFEKEIQIHYFTEKTFDDQDALAKDIKEEGISLLR